MDQFWSWCTDTLAKELRADIWYNGDQPYGLAGYINDFSSRMIGYATLRQIRAQNNSCHINSQMRNEINHCTIDSSLLNEERSNYGLNWTDFDPAYTPPNGYLALFKSFQFRKAEELKSLPRQGAYSAYMGGGYVYEMRGKLSFIKGNLTLLQQMNWIDRQTRAVVAEFSLFNPNINLLMVCSVLFEILPSGNLLAKARFEPVNLFSEVNAAKIASQIVYMAFILYFMIKEVRALIKSGFKAYITQFWSIIEWLIIAISWATFGLFFQRLSAAADVQQFFKQTSGYGYYKMDLINESNSVFTVCLALCMGLASIKFLKLFRFNNKIYSLALTLNKCAKELIGFGLIFALIWLAFVQLMYLMFVERLSSFSSVLSSMEASFEIMLGGFYVSPLIKDYPLIGSLIYVLFNVFVVFLLLNIFISIVCDSFRTVSEDLHNRENELEMFDYLSEKLKAVLGVGGRNKREKSCGREVSAEAYVDYADYLPSKVNQILFILTSKVEKNQELDKADKENFDNVRVKSANDRASKMLDSLY